MTNEKAQGIMKERDCWYVLFVRTGMEDSICSFLNQESLACFIPKKEVIHRNAGLTRILIKPMFPGYLFISSDLSQSEFHDTIQQLRSRRSGIVKELRYDTEGTPALTEDEQYTLDHLLSRDKVLKASRGIIENDMVVIMEGPLKGYESRITYIDRHKRQATLSLNLCTREVEVKVALEIVQKIHTTDS